MQKKAFFRISFASALTAFFAACSTPTVSSDDDSNDSLNRGEPYSSSADLASIYEAVEESGLYTTRDSVAAYLCKFDKLPDNYVGKNEGESLYESKTGKAFEKWNFNPWTTLGVMIGGDVFSNKEELLPKGSYHEADVDYSAKNRGTKRLVYESDCVIYYTSDHYESFTRLEVR